MGKKKELRQQVEYADQNAAWKQELLDCAEGEVDWLHEELASTINRVVELGEENDRLNDVVADLETVIVNLNRLVFGIGTTSKSVA